MADKITTVDEIIEQSTSNRFSIQVSLLAALCWFLAGSVINLSAQLSPYLRCDWKMSHFQIALASSVFFLGEGFGQWFCARLSDIYGRKAILASQSALVVYFAMLTASSPELVFFLAMRFIVGFGAGTVLMTSSVYISEFVKTKHRWKASLLISIGCALGYTYSIVVGYFVLNSYGWRIYLMCVAVPTVLVLPFITMMPESIRFLQITGQSEHLLKVITKICSVNQTPFPKAIDVRRKPLKNQASYSYLFQNYGLTTFALCILWIVLMMNYYGMAFLTVYVLENDTCNLPSSHQNITNPSGANCSKLKDNDFLQATIISLSDIPGSLICLMLIEIIGRKPVISIGLILNIVCYVLRLVCVPHTISMIILFLVRGLTTGISTILFLYTAELFPTIIRSTGAGFCGSLGKTCSVLTPFIFQELIYFSLPMTISVLTASSVLALLSLLFLKETLNQPLKEN